MAMRLITGGIYLAKLAIEQRRREIEQELRRLVSKEMRPARSAYWWYQLFARRIMRDGELRAQAMRFVDVFPALKNPEGINRHIKEYFAAGPHSSSLLFRGIVGAGRFPVAKHAMALMAGAAVGAMAGHFTIPAEPPKIIKSVKDIRRRGAEYSFDILGEQVLSEEEADIYKQKYLKSIGLLRGFNCPVNLSLKLSSLYSQFDPLAKEATRREVAKRLKEIARPVKDSGGSLTIDMEQFYLRGLIWEIAKELLSEEEFAGFANFGIAHQAYLCESEIFLEEIIQAAKERRASFWVRLVKGAYWDYEAIAAGQKNWPIPVYTAREQTDASFERNADIALENYPRVKTAIGSHNLSSVAYVMAKQEFLGLPKNAVEFQTLYGLGTPLIRPLKEMGYPVRVYVGTGNTLEGMSYLARRLLENTSQMSSAFFVEQGRIRR